MQTNCLHCDMYEVCLYVSWAKYEKKRRNSSKTNLIVEKHSIVCIETCDEREIMS